MAPLSDFEKQRQENIQRNKDLLRSLNLDSITESISREIPAKKPVDASKRRKTSTRTAVKREPAEPSRRSRRLAGVKVENSKEYAKIQAEMDALEKKKKDIEKLKQTRLFGEFHLSDLVTDSKGELKNEGKVIGKAEEESVKQEDSDEIIKKEDSEGDSIEPALSILRVLGEKFSAGDFYDLIREKETKNGTSDYSLESKRKEFDKMSLYKKIDPLDIKATHQRISSIAFHPATDDRLVVAGDTVGDLGVWAVDAETEGDEDDEATANVTILKPHGKLISKIVIPPNSPSQILSASYDGSVRTLDLNKLESSELAYLRDPYDDADYPLGVSDINLASPNLLYFTTLSGNFYQHDTRTKFSSVKESALLRLHDKKIGSFSVNPNLPHQIATASLDRTLRVWDLRNVSASNASWSEYESQRSPHLYGSYSSRLSVSCVDWNSQNRLVCNGYDDKICVFDLTSGIAPEDWSDTYQIGEAPKRSRKKTEVPTTLEANLEPFTTIKHNCQTGRWVSILKSKWQTNPEDGVQKFAIANMNRGIDVYDQQGQILAHLTEDKVGAVPAVVTMHPSKNWCIGGSASGKLYFFE
ncbi:DNA damage-binding protein Cmr1p [[Candida] anglica]